MSIYKGTELLAGVATNTIENAHELFDFIWSDHIKNSMSWLRAGTFSWQDGNLYVAAYNHLVADYSGGTSQTETVGSYTITYVLADDGHKITTDETTVANIYAESGSAWYYVLDTVNTRFKLPRGLHGTVVQSYQSGTDWYRVYSDGWCEQGGTANVGANSQYNGTFLKPFIDTNICFLATDNDSALNGNVYGYQQGCGVSSNSTFYLRTSYDSTVRYTWQACGYISGDFNDIEKYLYFYVGNFSQSATEQTAGLNSSLFNGKADTDLNNVSAGIDFVVESYQNGTEWYKLYKSGWVEQGGGLCKTGTITFLKEFADTNISLLLTRNSSYTGGISAGYHGSWTSVPSTTGFTCWYDANTAYSWYACGMSAQS